MDSAEAQLDLKELQLMEVRGVRRSEESEKEKWILLRHRWTLKEQQLVEVRGMSSEEELGVRRRGGVC